VLDVMGQIGVFLRNQTVLAPILGAAADLFS
jgi:hypothetical protein